MKGKAGRVYSITPKGEAALKAVQVYVEAFEKELASNSKNTMHKEQNKQ